MKKAIMLTCAVLFSLFSSISQANRILVTEIYGVIDSVDPILSNQFSIGDPFSGRFTIDLDAELAFQSELFNSTDGLAAYQGQGTGALSIGSGAQPFTIFNKSMKHFVANDYPFSSGPVDWYGASENTFFKGFPLETGSMSFFLNDPTGSMLSNYSLPLTAPDFVTGEAELYYDDGRFAIGRIDRVAISTATTAVPIGSPAWLLVAGLVSLLLISKSRRRRLFFSLSNKNVFTKKYSYRIQDSHLSTHHLGCACA